MPSSIPVLHEPAISTADVPWINVQLAASAIAASGNGGLRLVPVGELSKDPANVRQHPEKNHAATRASLKRFGQRTPIVVQSDDMIVRAGNDRLAIFCEEGWSHIAALLVDENNVEAAAYAIADNRSSELAEWDAEALNRQLHALQKEGIDLGELGFDDSDVADLLAGIETLDDDVDDPGPEDPPKVAAARTGDLWVLGDHRLLCGDSTRPNDISRLLAGEKAALLSTDPPYCVDYTGADRPQDSGKDWSHAYREIDITDLGDFLRAMFAAALPHVVDNAGIYMWHAHLQYPTIAKVFEEHGLLTHQPVIWVKPTSTFTYSYYRWAHEPCLFGWKKGHKPPHYLENKLTSVWEADWEGKARVVGNEHPTQKPLRLFEIPIEQHTRPGDVVLEPFSGSGSQLIAAEKLGRRCRALELSPIFVDAAIRRWQRATDKVATLDGTGRSFDDVAAERLGAVVDTEDEGGTDVHND